MATSGVMDVFTTRVIPLLAQIYPTWVEALFEYGENGLDAGAKRLWYVLMPDKVTVTDDGHGMVANMLPDDRGMLELFRDAVEGQRLKEGEAEDVRTIISPESLMSLEWMMIAGAFSPKLYQAGRRVRGVKGIGAIAFRRIGNRATWETMPARTITSDIPARPHRLTPASNQDLANFRSVYTIDHAGSPLTDPFGSPLVSGTRVEISDLMDDPSMQLRPAALAEQLQTRFGADIRARKVQVTLIDLLTREGRATPGGRIYNIEPPAYTGVVVANATRALRGGKAFFQVELFYDPEGRDKAVMLRRQGSDVRAVHTLPELNIPPFNSRKLSGFAEYVDLSEADAPWSPDKTIPLDGPVKRQWIEAMKSVGADVLAQVEEMDQRAADEQLATFARQLQELALSALREDPMFEGLLAKGLGLERPIPVPRGARNTVPHKRTEVIVRNEHMQGIPGIQVNLTTLAGKPLVERVTGVTGQVSFGELADGQYAVKLVGVAPGVTARDRRPLERVFRISVTNPRERISFDLVTGAREPDVRKLTGLRIWPHPLSDPGRPYSITRLTQGILEINTEHADLKRAIDTGNDELLIALFAEYVSAAVVEFTLSQQDPGYLLIAKTKLFAALFARLQAAGGARPRRTRKRKS